MVDVRPSPSQQRLQQCLSKLGLPADLQVNWQRLDQALTHPSAQASDHYEQLELLGDAVLRLAATECLQESFPQASVGELSVLRNELISDRNLAELASQLGLETYLITAPTLKPRAIPAPRLADAFEAVVAVLYLETRNLQLIRPWLDPHFQRLAQRLRQDPARLNYKDALQKLTQARSRRLPDYHTTEQHPIDGHPHRYYAEVWYQATCWGRGEGPTKKQAEQAAAAEAYQRLQATATE
ncbi:MAG TPA: ribonuclease III [Leptolyngbyaceae cyanobacterium M65_K2018_010]|nr:ribonuclease III [Leptolyngbyaceae cyanobacterium M65_K2018_010]